MEANFENLPDRISECFANKTILITGGTGFVGKVFIEKVLRSCSKVKKLYILTRTKKNVEPRQRLVEIFKGPLFELLKKQRGEEILTKVEAISANMELPDLDLSPEDRKKLVEEVQMVFHIAANVRFDESLRKAVMANVRGTKLILDLAKECKKMELFVHISTAYCHTEQKILEEQSYPPPADPHHVISTCEWLNESIIESCRKEILGKIPNIYAYTKAMAETLVDEASKDMRTMILRPSIIVPIYNEPVPGWIDTINGPMGLLVGAGKGVIRTMCGDPDSYADYIPVDIVVNSMVCAPFISRQTKKRFYNLTSSATHKVTFQQMIDIGRKIVENDVPFNWVLWYPGGSMKKSRWVTNVEFFLFQFLPAIFLDAILIVLGYKPIVIRIQKRIYKGYEMFEYFTSNQWKFNNEESLKVIEMLNLKEQQLYQLNIDNMDYYDYFKKATYAVRLYILKETNDTIPTAKIHMRVMWYVDKLCKTLFILGVLYMVYKYIVGPVLSRF